MVVLLFILTIVACLSVDFYLRRREKLQAAAETLAVRGEASDARLIPYWAAHELPGGLFFHSGHTWARIEPSGAVKVGLDGFAREVLGKIDRFELPAEGTEIRQGEPVFAALQSGKKIGFVSPVDGVVCAVNRGINDDPLGAKKEPYGKGWAFEIRPSNLPHNLKKLRIGGEASAWLAREVRSFAEFLTLHRAIPQEVGVTLTDGGIHADGILESMDGEILQLVIRKYFR